MTIEEHIKNLETIGYDGWTVTEEAYKSLQYAIKVLEQQPSEDCIRREAVMKCFKKWQPYMATRLWDYEQELKDLPSVTPHPRWIPCSERLPEKSTWVLVTCKNPDGYIFLDIKLINRYTELWDGDEDFIGTVLAWMPLPEPYDPKEKEK